MPQWSRSRSEISAKYPDERRTGLCHSLENARILVRYDHHTVWIDGRRALLLTYPWRDVPEASWPQPLPVVLSFAYAKGHPKAPPEVQDSIARLVFQAREEAALSSLLTACEQEK